MKNTKLFLSLLCSGAVIFASCNKEAILPNFGNSVVTASKSVVVNAYPAAIDEYVAANYPSETIAIVEQETHNDSEIVFEVTLSSGIELIFDENGVFLYTDNDNDDDDSDEIDPSTLPQAVVDYVFANYADAVIVEAEVEDEGYEVELADGTELLFDLEGNFLSEDSDDEDEDDDNDDDNDEDEDDDNDEDEDDDNDDADDSDETAIDPTALPQAILDYLAANYADLTIVESEIDNGNFDVELSDGTELVFDADGNFIEVEIDDEDDSDDDDDSDDEDEDDSNDDDDNDEDEDDSNDDDDSDDDKDDDNDEGTDDEDGTEG